MGLEEPVHGETNSYPRWGAGTGLGSGPFVDASVIADGDPLSTTRIEEKEDLKRAWVLSARLTLAG